MYTGTKAEIIKQIAADGYDVVSGSSFPSVEYQLNNLDKDHTGGYMIFVMVKKPQLKIVSLIISKPTDI